MSCHPNYDQLYADARSVSSLEELRWFVVNALVADLDAEGLVHASAACAVAGATVAEAMGGPLSRCQTDRVQWEFIRGWGKTPQGPRPDSIFSDEDQLADFVLYRRLNGLGFDWANGQDLLESVIQWRKLTKEEDPSHADEIQPCCGLPWIACGHKVNADRAYET